MQNNFILKLRVEKNMQYFLKTVLLLISFLFSNNLKVDQYELENGMTVMLNEDRDASGVYGVVIVKGGGNKILQMLLELHIILNICYLKEQLN